jgi:GT2 family glycosyltransferase
MNIDMRESGPAATAFPLPGEPAAARTGLRGYVEIHGYHALAGGWFFAGWTEDKPDFGNRLRHLAAQFAEATVTGEAHWLFYPREDLPAGHTGFVLFIKTETCTPGAFGWLQFELDGAPCELFPVVGAAPLPETRLIPALDYLVAASPQAAPRELFAGLLHGDPDHTGTGYIEFFGYQPAAGGWFVSGWVSNPWPEAQGLERCVLSFDEGDVRGEIIAALYHRAELASGARGALLFIRAPRTLAGPLRAVRLAAGPAPGGGQRSTLTPVANLAQLGEPELSARIRALTAKLKPGLTRDRLTNLMARLPYAGQDTLNALSPGFNLHIDETIHCGAAGLVLIGWMLAKPGIVREIRVHCGSRVSVLDLARIVRVERPDVLTEFARHGFDETACGFIAYLPNAREPDSQPYIEVDTQREELAFRHIIRPVRTGLPAMQRLLGAVDMRFEELRAAFDHVLGPAVAALNQERLASPVGRQVLDYGVPPSNPLFSVIIPLHGRLDFVEYQQALFSARPDSSSIEYIYVLDDPAARREAQNLFASVHARFQIPFRAVLLERNVGFAPANNIGMAYAHGEYLVYLNSDVFPGTLDWLEQLAAAFSSDPSLGVIGPLLLFEDGSIQHNGMYFEPLPEYANWYFCQHHDKGLRPTGGTALTYFPSITGACMMLPRALAMQIGGFDETYIIGDFEDSDLCLKLQSLGLRCAVDPAVKLYHLERKSQISSATLWRANLTAYNAWEHDRRWARIIAQLPFEAAASW